MSFWSGRRVLIGADPYSSSKGCAELVARSYRKSFFRDTPLTSVRAGNVMGGGDWSEDRLVPDCIRAFERSERAPIRNPNSLRPWQHVLDPLSGYLLVAERMLAGQALEEGYNFGPSTEQIHSVAEVVGAVAREWGGDAAWCTDSKAAPPESRRPESNLLLLDSTLARRTLGWKPRLDFEECVAWTVEWYRRHGSGEDMREFTYRQIEQYGCLRRETSGSAGFPSN